jgi:hypothetical protein
MLGPLTHRAQMTRHRIGVCMKRTALGLLLVTGLLAAVITSGAHAGRALADDTDRVGLVVKFSDGTVFTDCIEYTGSGMTGEDVLDSSGLSTVKEFHPGLGAAICKIEDDGCDYPQPDSCFCECLGSSCEYWAYYHLDEQEGEWIYSGMGASWRTVRPGDVEGWAWGAGTPEQSEAEPPLTTFEELCAPPTPTPKPSPPIVDFTADPEHILVGQCSTLRWSVENGEVVVLDGEGVQPDDARYLCPSESHTYELQVLNAAGEYSYELTIEVAQPTATPLPTVTPTPVPSATPGTTSASPPPPTSTPVPDQKAPSPSPSQPPSPTSTQTATVAAVAMAHTATPTITVEHDGEVAEPGDVAAAEVTSPETASSAPAPPETVGLDRILLLLGVGAGTLGFGTMVFVAMLVLLVTIYIRARAQF